MSQHHKHLSLPERHVLAAYLQDDLSLRAIAAKLRRSVSTVSDEIRKNSTKGYRDLYDPDLAHLLASFRQWNANRHNPLKNPKVFDYVIEHLIQDQWSPETISQCMVERYPRDTTMRISHETVYQFINAEEGKQLQLAKHLRRGKLRKHRRRRMAASERPQNCFQHVRSVHERPTRAQKRQRYGDWESDTMEGKRSCREVISVQEERRSRKIVLTKVPDRTAASTCKAILARMGCLHAHMRRSLTFDRGTENAEYASIEAALGLRTYFCDPYSSWQKGAVENTIGLLRQYIPKGTDISQVTHEDLQRFEDKLNNRPRKCLGWKTPHEVFSAQLSRLSRL